MDDVCCHRHFMPQVATACGIYACLDVFVCASFSLGRTEQIFHSLRLWCMISDVIGKACTRCSVHNVQLLEIAIVVPNQQVLATVLHLG